MKPYPKYKESGVEWLGEIPEEWEYSRVKHLSYFSGGKFIDGDWIETPLITDYGVRLIQCGNIGTGVFEEQGFRYISEESFLKLKCTEVLPNDILICRLQSSKNILAGRACLAPSLNYRMITSVDNCILRPKPTIVPQYIIYLINTEAYLNFVESISRGGTRDRISRSMLGQFVLYVPPLAEQKAIATFLDRETQKIDTLIAKQEQLITLLEEKRQALISHAVTKGLDPNAKMKDSGVEWLGEIPEGWDKSALKNFAKIICGYAFNSEDFIDSGIPVIRISNIDFDGGITLDNIKCIEEKHFIKYSNYTVSYGDIVMAMTGGTIGKTSIYNLGNQSLLNQRVCRFVNKSKLNKSFLYFNLISYFYQEQIKLNSVGGAQPNISDIQLVNIAIACPPLKEQNVIAGYLLKQNNKVDILKEKAQSVIDLLKEKRSALISSAVTGKIDVREAV